MTRLRIVMRGLASKRHHTVTSLRQLS